MEVDETTGTTSVDPQVVLAARLGAALAAVLGPEQAPVDPVLRPAKPSFGDYQANFAMGLGKRLGHPPREIAADVVERLDAADLIQRAEVAGPGFVNITLRSDWLAARAGAVLRAEDLAVPAAQQPLRTVIDYSAPNIAKEMHVGHLRTTIIGDALARILGALGHEVIRQNHIGDWGTPFGMLIEHLVDIGEARAAGELSVGDLGTFYRAARVKFDDDAGFADRARRRVVALQSGDATTLRMWRLLVDRSARYFETVYGRLGVLLRPQDNAGESVYNPLLDDVVAELERLGLAIESDGALCVFPPGFSGREGKPLPLIIRKRDGGYNYAATDLAAIRHRLQTLHAKRLIYVVGVPQTLHFTMVFAVARMAGWLPDYTRAEHAAFGSILGADGKLLRTRSGEPIKLIDLLDEAVERATKGLTDRDGLSPSERAEVARQVGIGAVKYADLSYARDRDYVFNWDTMLALEGNTGPYLQYAVARINSLIDRSGEHAGSIANGEIVIGHDAERALVIHALGFGREVHAVAETLEPHRLCGYLYELATRFTAFYENCPVLRAPDDRTRRSRLALSLLAARTLTRGLGLLGIEVPRRM